MPALPRKFRLAVSAVLYLAYNGGGKPVRSPFIAERYDVPKRYLEPVLQQMVRDGILSSERGPRGGYRLGRDRTAISLADIARSVAAFRDAEEESNFFLLTEGEELVLQPIWNDLTQAMMAFLAELTIQELCNRAHQKGLDGVLSQTFDYAI
jgi:Rrf2 family transcriptional regulator, iron-sulfur cluster assembly transcription factor